jgi:hypothetical protein
MSYELYHAGVKGMKWGVRKDERKSSSSNRQVKKSNTKTTKTTETSKTTTITKTRVRKKRSVSSKIDTGSKIVDNANEQDVKKLIANSTAIAAGAMRVAAAFVPGAQVLSGVATATSLVGTLASLK